MAGKKGASGRKTGSVYKKPEDSGKKLMVVLYQPEIEFLKTIDQNRSKAVRKLIAEERQRRWDEK